MATTRLQWKRQARCCSSDIARKKKGTLVYRPHLLLFPRLEAGKRRVGVARSLVFDARRPDLPRCKFKCGSCLHAHVGGACGAYQKIRV